MLQCFEYIKKLKSWSLHSSACSISFVACFDSRVEFLESDSFVQCLRMYTEVFDSMRPLHKSLQNISNTMFSQVYEYVYSCVSDPLKQRKASAADYFSVALQKSAKHIFNQRRFPSPWCGPYYVVDLEIILAETPVDVDAEEIMHFLTTMLHVR